jgi:hypothetical protein
MADELTKQWGQFSFSDKECAGVEAIGSIVEALESRGQPWLVGKLAADKIIGNESI